LKGQLVSSPPNLHQAIKRLDTLPAVPRIAQKILSLRITTDEDDRALFALIEKDPPILSKVIGMSNSPLFGTGREILTVHDAEALLGSKRVKMIALSFAMLSAMTRVPSGLLNINSLWQHSLSVAITMDTLASLMPSDRRPSDDEIYLAGLLHDIGFLVLDHLDPRLSDKFHARLAAEPGRPVEEIEAEMLEMNHFELGAELGRHWDLPESIIAVIRYHHTFNDEQAAVGRTLATLANLAEKLLPTFGIAESVQTGIADEEWQSLGIDPVKADEIKATVQEHTKEVTAICS
jgi:putative nucleotidyltransferase with HDIG domain